MIKSLGFRRRMMGTGATIGSTEIGDGLEKWILIKVNCVLSYYDDLP